MSLRLTTNSTDAWSAVLWAIETAKQSIYIEMYIFTEDTAGTHDFVGALMERARAGVQVIMILDAFGSLDLKKETITRLTDAGVEIRFFRHWIHRTHKKTIIVDGTRGFVGGVNITGHARTWNDLQLEVSGLIVGRLLKVFARTYALSKGVQELRLPKPRPYRTHRVRMWILEHTPVASRLTLKAYYIRKLAEADARITFVTPYFTPHRWLFAAMKGAIKRGVTVEVLLPKHTDSKVFDIINRYYAAQAVALGVVVYTTRGINHAKAALIDDTEGLIGSANIDSLSFERNSELGIFFTDRNTIRDLAETIDQWKASATSSLTTTYAPLPWYSFPLALILRLIHPFL